MNRIRVLDSCPWPERRGLSGRIVNMPLNTYPARGLGKNEVIILIEDDPLNGPATRYRQMEWTCVIDRNDIEEI